MGMAGQIVELSAADGVVEAGAGDLAGCTTVTNRQSRPAHRARLELHMTYDAGRREHRDRRRKTGAAIVFYPDVDKIAFTGAPRSAN